MDSVGRIGQQTSHYSWAALFWIALFLIGANAQAEDGRPARPG